MAQQSLQAVSEFARPCAPHAILARFAHEEIINSLASQEMTSSKICMIL